MSLPLISDFLSSFLGDDNAYNIAIYDVV